MEVKNIPLPQVIPDPRNPRKTFDPEGIKELAQSIRQQGLHQPITVRVNTRAELDSCQPRYMIVCGERRYRAYRWLQENCAQYLNASIPAIVKEMSDAEALDAMITENLQRKDVDPMEEAFAFGELAKLGQSTEEIALRFGKSVRFINDRVKLNTLIPELQLALKDGKIPIAACMLICKLDTDGQASYYKQYGECYVGMNKANAESFVYNRFMELERAPWDAEFNGGCGKKCGECPLNTRNAACLFYEMNVKDAGRCTSRKGYCDKSATHMLAEVERYSDQLVKAGEPLQDGKMVIGIEPMSYAPDELKKLHDDISDILKAKGYEIVNPSEIFNGCAYYDIDDVRTRDILEQGRGYRVLQLFSYSSVDVTPKVWYKKLGNTSVSANADQLPVKVQQLLNQLESARKSEDGTVAVAIEKAFKEFEPPVKPLTNEEMELMAVDALRTDYNLPKKFMTSALYSEPGSLRKFIRENPDKVGYILRFYLRKLLICPESVGKDISPFRYEVLGAWDNEKFTEAEKAGHEAYQKKIDKIIGKLEALGYDDCGEPLPKTENIEVPPKGETYVSTREQYAKLKKEHPECLLLFRVGNFYELYKQDAIDASSILGITLTKRADGKKAVTELAGFPHHALDTYLPRLIRAGRRVAVCEPSESSEVKRV